MRKLRIEHVLAFCLLCLIGWFIGRERVENVVYSFSSLQQELPLTTQSPSEPAANNEVPAATTNETLENSIFIYRAYLDSRGPSTRIRVLSFNRCYNTSVLHVQIGETLTPLNPVSEVLQCPEIWAPGCFLVAYFHELEVADKNLFGNEIMIKGPTQQAVLPLYRAEPTRQLGITVCIAPMFWYTDWTKLIVFIEYWRKQQAENIMVYVHSTSADVRKVLDFYEKKRWITIISWPMLPGSPTFQPSDEIYRLGQVLAHNDCFLRTTTEFTAVVDIDEMLHSKNEPLTNYILKYFENKQLGSLSFPHRAAVFDPPLFPKPFSFENVDYKGVLNFKYNNDFRQPKLIARTDAIESMAVHHVISFRNGEHNEMAKDAVLFHIRYDMDLTNSTLRSTNLVADPQWFQLDLLSKTRLIFPNGASFNEETQNALGKCTDSWRETQANCKAPVTFCRAAVIDKETWVEETENVFTVL